MSEKHEVIVVIPFYHIDLSEKEIISLKQVYKVLGKYDLCLIAPLRLKPFLQNDKYQVEYFEDTYFEGVSAYNQLMLAKEFYERFIKFSYVLIYQLDAFVFYDKLSYFCSLGYDYIGSPWIYPEMGKVGETFQKTYVGNGGLSLRNTRNCMRLLDDKALEVKDYAYNEDFFFSVAKDGFKVASLSTALEFCFETHVRKCFEINDRKLPFGCHAWERYDYSFWKPYMENQGYDLSKLEIKTGSEDQILDRELEGYKYRLLNTMHIIPIVMQKLLKRYDLEQAHFTIWGAGKYGQQIVELLLQSGVKVDYVIDENKMLEGKAIYKIPIVDFQTYKSLNLDNMVIIAVKKFIDEIQKILEENNFIKKRDFLSILDLADLFYIEFLYNMCKE